MLSPTSLYPYHFRLLTASGVEDAIGGMKVEQVAPVSSIGGSCFETVPLQKLSLYTWDSAMLSSVDLYSSDVMDVNVKSSFKDWDSSKQIVITSSSSSLSENDGPSTMGVKELFCKNRKTSDSSLKNSWAAYGPGNSNHLEIILTELKDP